MVFWVIGPVKRCELIPSGDVSLLLLAPKLPWQMNKHAKTVLTTISNTLFCLTVIFTILPTMKKIGFIEDFPYC
jgi:hypothetical protein